MTVSEAGRKGGEARKSKLSKDRQIEIARKAGIASGKARRKSAIARKYTQPANNT